MSNSAAQSSLDFWQEVFNVRISQISDGTQVKHALATTRSIWDEEADALKHVLTMVGLRQNAHRLPASLPFELLARIFEIIVHDDPIESRYHQLGWAVVSQVCRHWRHVALNHAPLWTYVDFNRGVLPKRLLDRAGKAPLHISGLLDYHTTLLRFVLDHITQIRSLDVSGVSGNCELLNKSLNKYTPELRSLSLRSENMSVPVKITSDFLGALTPNLQHLTLSGYHFPWTAANSNLRTLNLTFTEPSVSIIEITEGLRMMPKLDCLLLNIPSNTLHASLSATESRVALPLLRDFTVVSSAELCLSLWRSLDLLPDASIHIICITIPGIEMYSELSLELDSHLSRAGSPTFRHAKIRHFDEFLLQLTTVAKRGRVYRFTPQETSSEDEMFLEPPPDPRYSHDTTSGSEFFLQLPPDVRNRSMWHPITGVLPSHQWETFSYDGKDTFPQDDVTALLGPAKRLRHIGIYGGSETFLVAVLDALASSVRDITNSKWKQKKKTRAHDKGGQTMPGPSRSQRTQPPNFLPELKSMCLSEVIFTLGDSYPAKKLTYTLRVRHKGGYGIQELEISDCAVNEESINFWRKIVPKVQWDEITRGTGFRRHGADEYSYGSYDDYTDYVEDYDDVMFYPPEMYYAFMDDFI